ncbi:hypothetical protein [Acetobacter aceti]|nr:hypothetical protein [Acetobacter aceti]
MQFFSRILPKLTLIGAISHESEQPAMICESYSTGFEICGLSAVPAMD